MSWKAEVIADDSGNWIGNALRFATKPEAESYASDLYSRWIAAKKTQVVESDEPVNYRWDYTRGLVNIEAEQRKEWERFANRVDGFDRDDLGPSED